MNRNQQGEFASPVFLFMGLCRSAFCPAMLVVACWALGGSVPSLHAEEGPTPTKSEGRPVDVASQDLPAGPSSIIRVESLAPLQFDDGSAEESGPKAPPTAASLLKIVLLECLSDEIVDERHWGKTRKRWDGFDIYDWEISKKNKIVNHGFWRRYKASLVRPEETLKIELTQEKPLKDGTIPFVVRLVLRARCEATFARWNYGVKGINGTMETHAILKLRLVLHTNPTVKFSLDSPLPKLDLRPTVESVDIRLSDLDLERVGVFDGRLIELIGDGSRGAIENLVQRQEKTILRKLRERLDEEL